MLTLCWPCAWLFRCVLTVVVFACRGSVGLATSPFAVYAETALAVPEEEARWLLQYPGIKYTSDHAGTQQFPLGTTDVHLKTFTVDGSRTGYMAADETTGAPSTCEIAVTVTDQQPPAVKCPKVPIVVGTDQGKRTFTRAVPVPAYLDAVDPSPTAQVQVHTGFAGIWGAPQAAADVMVLEMGEHRARYTITDSSQNAAVCIVNITVQDKEPPAITCPVVEASYSTDSNGNTRTLQLSSATAQDNVELASNLHIITPPPFVPRLKPVKIKKRGGGGI